MTNKSNSISNSYKVDQNLGIIINPISLMCVQNRDFCRFLYLIGYLHTYQLSYKAHSCKINHIGGDIKHYERVPIIYPW